MKPIRSIGVLFAILLTACAVSRTQTTRTLRQTTDRSAESRESFRSDSLGMQQRLQQQRSTEQRQTLLITRQEVAAESVRLEIPMERLRELPEGAVFGVPGRVAS